MSIGLDAAGEFAVKSAKHRSGVADWSWQVAGLDRDLQPHAPPAAADATPFDMSVNGDTIHRIPA